MGQPRFISAICVCKYKDKEVFYILTAIGGAIVTFQLTREGHTLTQLY